MGGYEHFEAYLTGEVSYPGEEHGGMSFNRNNEYLVSVINENHIRMSIIHLHRFRIPISRLTSRPWMIGFLGDKVFYFKFEDIWGYYNDVFGAAFYDGVEGVSVDFEADDFMTGASPTFEVVVHVYFVNFWTGRFGHVSH